MPAGSLDPVVQPVSADTSRYKAEWLSVLPVLQQVRDLQKEVMAGAASAGGGAAGAAAAADIARTNAAIREQLAVLREHQSVVGTATGATSGFGAAHAAVAPQIAATAAAVRDHTSSVSDLTAGYEAARASIASMAADALQQNELMAASFKKVNAEGATVSATVAATAAALGAQARASGDSAASLLPVAASLGTIRDNARDATSALADTTAAVAAAKAAAGTGLGGGVQDLSGRLDALTGQLQDFLGSAAGAGRGGGGGGGAFLGAAAGAAAGGGGGDGGGAGVAAAVGGFLSRLTPSNIFGGAMPTLQAAHMTAMLAMETLSTVLPALVAAGAAGAVGMQGAGNVYLRGQSMYTAAEALGGAYGGATLGSMVGMSSGFQNAQNIANGGVYGITGGLVDMAKSSQGAFGQMGDQTIAMIDRGIADMVLNNRMGQVTQALAGGTGFLRSFGDIGANIGDTLLNLAPNLPGIGQGLLGGLKGVTGLANTFTHDVPGPLLGAGLAGEAGYRWGSLLLGGGKLPFWLGGGKITGAAGLAERLGLGQTAATANKALAGSRASMLASGLGEGDLAALGIGEEGSAAGSGLAGILAGGAVGLPIGALTAIAALSAWGISKGQFGSSIANQMSPYQAAISSAYGSEAWQPVGSALYQANKTLMAPPGLSNDVVAGQAVTVGSPIAELMRTGVGRTQAMAEYEHSISSYSQSFGSQLGNLIAEGPAVQKALAGIGDKGASLSDSFAAVTQAMIPLSDMAGGKLNAQGTQMLKQWAQTYDTLSTGGTGAPALIQAGAANYIMSTSQMKSLSTINQGLDAMTQIMTGGPAGQATMSEVLGGLGSTLTGIGPAPAAAQTAATDAQIAKALASSFTSPTGAAAWTAFTNGTATTPGIIATSQQNMDQLRTALTLGALTGAQGTALGAYQVQQYLGLGAQSPAALAMIQQQAMQANIPGLTMGASYQQTAAAINAAAATPGQANQLETQQVQKLANLPAVAYNLLTGGQGFTDIGQQALTSAATQALAVQAAAMGGKSETSSLQGLTSSLIGGGVKNATQYQAALQASLEGAGLTGTKLNQAVQAGTVIYKSEVEPPKPPAPPKPPPVTWESIVKPPVIPPIGKQPPVVYDTKVTPPALPPQPKPNPVLYTTKIPPPVLPPNPVPAPIIVPEYIVQVSGGGGTGVVPTPSGGVNFNRAVTQQTGGLIPGYGGGDIVPAMLEPGELVVPKHLAGSLAGLIGMAQTQGAGSPLWRTLAPFARLFGINHPGLGKGFATGGVVPPGDTAAQLQALINQDYTHLDTLTKGSAASNAYWSNTLDPLYAALDALKGKPASATTPGATATATKTAAQQTLQQFIANLNAEVQKSGIGKDFAVTVLQGMKNGLGTSAAESQSASLAKSLVTQIQQAASYAQTQSAAMMSAGGLANLPGMTLPQTAAQMAQSTSVVGGMQNYTAGLQQFTADYGALGKQGLNKNLMSQILAMGPIQGDQYAQSILGAGTTGGSQVRQANAAFAAMTAAANKFGATAAHIQYPGVNLNAGGNSASSTVNNVSISISAGSGQTLSLTAAQITQLTQEIQAKLLKATKKNGTTGINLKKPYTS